jgi:hypothetical protein
VTRRRALVACLAAAAAAGLVSARVPTQAGDRTGPGKTITAGPGITARPGKTTTAAADDTAGPGNTIAAPGETLTADEIARRIRDRDTGRDSRAELRMRLYDRQGRVRERALTLSALRRGTGDRVLVRFTYPNDIRGTSLLVWEHRHEDDERFLYLPALGRVRRIAGEEKQGSFAGSDLSYEDVGGRDVADYTYRIVDETATWQASDGSRTAAWLLESRARDTGADYPRSLSLVLKDRFIVVHGEMFDRRDARAKTFDVRRLERIDGVWTPLDLVVVNHRDGTRTELLTSSIRYDTGLTEDAFSRRALEAGAGRSSPEPARAPSQ